jgi:hypothetical protein
MASKRKFYKTVVQVTILSDEKVSPDIDLYSIHHQITDGGWSGEVEIVKSKKIDGKAMAKELMNQNSDPEYCRLDKNGNDLE